MDVAPNREGLRLSNEESNQLTRECLSTAMMRLMSEKPIESITIAELVKLAGVSRMAFYRNYGTKEVLAKAVAHDVIHRLVRDFSDGFGTQDKRAWYVRFFETMLTNRDYLKIILSEYTPVDVSQLVDELSPRASAEERYFYIGRGGALLNILKQWYRCGLKEGPEEMASLCDRFFSVFR